MVNAGLSCSGSLMEAQAVRCPRGTRLRLLFVVCRESSRAPRTACNAIRTQNAAVRDNALYGAPVICWSDWCRRREIDGRLQRAGLLLDFSLSCACPSIALHCIKILCAFCCDGRNGLKQTTGPLFLSDQISVLERGMFSFQRL